MRVIGGALDCVEVDRGNLTYNAVIRNPTKMVIVSIGNLSFPLFVLH